MNKKLKISEKDFKSYLLSNYVDEDGNKVSDRILWSTEEFFDYTGMYSINKYTGEKQMVSTGTISYWKDKLDVKEEEIYKYNTTVTNRIKVDFEEWSRKNNKGYTKEKSISSNDTIKRKLIKYVGLPKKYEYMSLDDVSRLALSMWKNLGFNAEEEMKKFYKRVV